MNGTVVKATDTGRRLPAKDNWPEKTVWELEVSVNGSTHSATMFLEPAKGEPSGPVTLQQQDNGEYRAYVPRRGGGGGGDRKYEADPRGLRGKNASSALHAAIAATEGKEVTSDDIVALADKFYDFIEKQAKVDGPVGGG